MVNTNTSPHQFIQRLAETRAEPELRNKLRDPLFLLLRSNSYRQQRVCLFQGGLLRKMNNVDGGLLSLHKLLGRFLNGVG